MADEDPLLREILLDAKTIAVAGINDDESEDAFRVPTYLQENGVNIVPVKPKIKGLFGKRSFGRLADVNFDVDVDVVNLFRPPENTSGRGSEILGMKKPPKTVWMKLGIFHGQVASERRGAGITLIQDRRIMADHRRLVGATQAVN